ncbi:MULTISPECIES: SGNH/GDSL hydrolase family protein [Thermoleptolyngbya]|nr:MULTISPECIES: SGNH/GDSL hydrolase family protein [Thermoleptolyngbya]
MRDRSLQFAIYLAPYWARLQARLRQLRAKWRSQPPIVRASLIANAVMLTLLTGTLLRHHHTRLAPSALSQALPQTPQAAPPPATQTGTRHLLNYQQWVDLLQQEAIAAAENPPERLAVLLGDSISLWFPPDLLPPERNWINQGISGDTTDRLRARLHLLDPVQPQTIVVMIGINDLIWGADDAAILSHYRDIVRYLRHTHPGTQVLVQSILPHAAEQATWEGRDRLLALPNSRIRALNQQLAAIAQSEGAYYLDLYPLFANAQGNLKMFLSTDGLHLNSQGYLVWRAALQLYLRQTLPTG